MRGTAIRQVVHRAGAWLLLGVLALATDGGHTSAQTSAVRWIAPYGGQGLAVDPTAQRVFVFDAGTLTTLNARTGAREQQVTVPGASRWGGGVVDQAAGQGLFLFPAGQQDATVALLDTHSGLVLHTVAAPVPARFLAEDTQTQRVYLSGSDANGTLAVLDAASGQALSTIPLGAPGAQVAVDAPSGRVFVVTLAPSSAGMPGPGAVLGKGTLRIVDATARRVIQSIPLGRNPSALALDPSSGHLFVSNTLDNTVSVIDGRSGRTLATVATNPAPTDVVVDAAHARAYVLCEGSWQSGDGGIVMNGAGTVDVLDTQTGTVLLRIPVGAYARVMALDPRTGYLIIGSAHGTPVGNPSQTPFSFTGSLHVVTTGTRPAVRELAWPRGNAPMALAVDSQDGRVYILSQGSTTLGAGTVSGFIAMLDESRL